MTEIIQIVCCATIFLLIYLLIVEHIKYTGLNTAYDNAYNDSLLAFFQEALNICGLTDIPNDFRLKLKMQDTDDLLLGLYYKDLCIGDYHCWRDDKGMFHNMKLLNSKDMCKRVKTMEINCAVQDSLLVTLDPVFNKMDPAMRDQVLSTVVAKLSAKLEGIHCGSSF